MLGDVVRANRRRLGLSQEDLADRAGLSVRGIRKIEAHRTGRPRPATVRLLADAFELAGAERDLFCQAALGVDPAPATSSRVAQPPPSELVGRDDELAALEVASAAAAAGRFHMMWIRGEAGAGKSTLSRAIAARLTQRGWHTAFGASPEVDGVPSAWAWADVVRGLLPGATLDGAGDDLVERLRPFIVGDTGAADWPAPARFWLARTVVAVLGRQAGPRPLLVVLDDVHRAGDGTLQILRYAATELAEHPVLVLATLRPTETSPLLSSVVAALAGPRSGTLDLTGLSETDVGQLLSERLGRHVAPEHVRLITARTGGNPLFVGETARLIADQGIGAATELVPSGVIEVLRRRLADVPSQAQAVLRTAAVFGIEVEVEAILSVDPTAAEATLDGLDLAVRAGLLTEPAPGMVRFSHVLIRDTIYQGLSGVRRVSLHAQALRALRRSRPTAVVALAHHALASATTATARSAATQAAEAALSALGASGYGQATTLLTGAIEVLSRPLERLAGDDELRLDLLCTLVSAQGHAGNVRAARESRDQAIGVALRLGDHRSLARAYTAYDAPTLWTHREYQALDHTLVDGIETTLATVVGASPATRCRLLATLANEIEATDPDRTDQASGEAVEIAAGLDDPVLLCRALNARYRYIATLGPDRWSDLDDIGEQQLRVATSNGLNAYQTQAHHIISMARLARNDLDGAQAHLDRALEHATSGQLGLALGIIAMFKGLRELIAGRFDAAERTYAPVIAQLRQIGSPNIDEVDLLIRFCIEHARPAPGNQQRLTALARQARSVHERFGTAVAEPYTRLLIAAGHLDEARTVWRPETAIPHDHYWFRWTALRAENAVRLHDPATAATCYRQLLPWRGHLPGLLHAHVALGPIDHVLGELAAALGRPADAARHYSDAVRVADAIGAAHWASRAQQALDSQQADRAHDARAVS